MRRSKGGIFIWSIALHVCRSPALCLLAGLSCTFVHVHVNRCLLPPFRASWPCLSRRDYSQGQIFKAKWRRAEQTIQLRLARIQHYVLRNTIISYLILNMFYKMVVLCLHLINR